MSCRKQQRYLNQENTEIWIKGLKQKLRQSQIKASVKVNSVLLEFYWQLGALI